MRLTLLFVFLFPLIASAQRFRIHGVVYSGTGQPLASAHVHFPKANQSVGTDSLGAFSILHVAGHVRLEVSFTGYKKAVHSLELKKDTVLYLFLESKTEQLEEVVVSGNRILQSDQFESARTSVLSLSEKEISSIPVLGGEADLIKVLQLLPGTSKGVEGSTD